MLKKVPHKRKLKHFSKKILFLCLLFFATLSILCSLYGVLFLQKNRLASPLALLGQKFRDSSKLEENINKIRAILDKNAISYSSITSAENNTTLVTLTDGKEVILANTKNVEQQIASLQLIMRQLTIEGKRFNRIDFRFDNPVVTF